MAFYANLAECKSRLGQYVTNDEKNGAGEPSQECPMPVKELAGAPATSQWRRGVKVKGNTILPGTAIATFPKQSGGGFRYSGHAAIYIGQSAGGIDVYDQWNGRRFNIRHIPFRCTNSVSNDGEAFYVIELTEVPSSDPALCSSSSYYLGPGHQPVYGH